MAKERGVYDWEQHLYTVPLHVPNAQHSPLSKLGAEHGGPYESNARVPRHVTKGDGEASLGPQG